MITNWLEIFVVVVVFSSIFSKAVGSTFDIIDVRISVMPKYSLLIDLKKKNTVFPFNCKFVIIQCLFEDKIKISVKNSSSFSTTLLLFFLPYT